MTQETEVFVSYGSIIIERPANGGPYIELRCWSHDGCSDILLTPSQAEAFAEKLLEVARGGHGQAAPKEDK